MIQTVRRQVSLPRDERSQALARSVVLEVLAEAGLPQLADEAAIATTELATNGLLTAGTAMELQVVAGPSGVTVTLSDPVPSMLTPRRAPAEAGDLVHGLDLIDSVASSWGTNHDRGGKSIWFTLDSAPETAAAARDASAAASAVPFPDSTSAASRSADRHRRSDRAAGWLTHLPEHVAQQLTTEETLT